MIRKITYVLSVLSVLSISAQTSNVQTVRAWTRTHVIGLPGGRLLDASGSIADAQRAAAAEAAANESSNIVAGAAIGLTNALARLWSEAHHTNDYTGRLYISADLDSDPGYENVEAFRVSESIETNGTLHYYTHFTREISVAPKTVWSFEVAPGVVYWAPGTTSTNNATTNVLGYACYDIVVKRPSAVGNAVIVCNKFLKFGAPDTPLDIPDAGLRIISGSSTNTPFTGDVIYTNAVDAVTNVITETYLSGFLHLISNNSIGGNP